MVSLATKCVSLARTLLTIIFLRMSIRWKVRRPLTLISQIWKPSARW